MKVRRHREVSSPARSSCWSAYSVTDDRSQACIRRRPAVSPPAGRCRARSPGHSVSAAGIRSMRTRGDASRRGGSRTGRRGWSAQRRWYGVNTAKWSLSVGATVPGGTTTSVSPCTTSSRSRSASSFSSRCCRLCAYALQSPEMWTVRAPTSSANAATSRAVSPRRITRPSAPRCFSVSSRSRRASTRNDVRLGASTPSRGSRRPGRTPAAPARPTSTAPCRVEVVVHAQVAREQGDRRRRPHRAGCTHGRTA